MEGRWRQATDVTALPVDHHHLEHGQAHIHFVDSAGCYWILLARGGILRPDETQGKGQGSDEEQADPAEKALRT